LPGFLLLLVVTIKIARKPYKACCGARLVFNFIQIFLMKYSTVLSFLLIILISSGAAQFQEERIEFVCLKMHKATNTCHFNFIIDGAKYRHVDMGCKFSKKKDELIKKVKEGTAALARDWKIDCPEAK
jgi:hypothetical protein